MTTVNALSPVAPSRDISPVVWLMIGASVLIAGGIFYNVIKR